MCRYSYIWNPTTCSCEDVRYEKSVTDSSVITCDEIVKLTKSIMTKTISAKSFPMNLNRKKVTCKINNAYILLVFLLITMMVINYH